MAKQLGMGALSLIKSIPSPSQPWKMPVKEWIRDLYEKKFRAKLPDRVTDYEPPWVETDAFGEDDDLERSHNEFLREQYEALEPCETLHGNLRLAGEYVARELASIPEIVRVALFGSVAQPPDREYPNYPHNRLALVRQYNDVDLAIWITDLSHLKNLHEARARALNLMFNERDIAVPHFQVDMYILEPGTHRYRGRLCDYSECPEAGRKGCMVDGCGAQPFLRLFPDYTFDRFEFRHARKEILFEREWAPETAPTGNRPSRIDRLSDHDVPF